MPKRKIRRRTAILFSTAIMLVCITGIILFRSGQSYVRLEKARMHQREILSNAGIIESLSKDMWGAMRGYIITGEERFLQPYNKAQQEIDAPLTKLKQLIDSSSRQTGNIALLSRLVQQRKEFSARLIIIRKGQGFEAARSEILKGYSASNMDSIRIVTDNIRNAARAELLKLNTSHSNTVNHTLSAFIVLVACTICILLLAYIYVNKAYRKLSNAEDDLRQLNNELDHKVKERTIELSHQVNQFHTLTESLPQIIWTAEANGHIDYVNHQWAEFTGMPLKIATATGWPEVVHPDDTHKAADQWIEAVKSRSTYQAEYRIKRADGTYYWFLVRAYPLKDDLGNIYKWIGTCTDIDEHKRQMEMKDEFISLTSHELRTPITTIKAYMQLIERCIQEDPDCDAGEYLKKTHVFVDRLSAIVNDLHQTTKAQAGKLQLQKSSFDFEEFVKDMVNVLQQTNTQHRILLSGSANVVVKADRAKLEQVFTNYLSNAIKYSPNADKVLVNITTEKDYVVVAVRDFGIGIPQDKIDKVFNRFFRAANTGSIEGLGLGLFLSRKIIGAHGGKVWVESEEGKGSTFFFCVPVGDK